MISLGNKPSLKINLKLILMKKNILLLTRVSLNRDPRVLRQIDFLKEKYNLYLASHDDQYENVEDCINTKIFQEYTFHLKYPTLLRKFFSFFVKLEKKTSIISFFHQLFFKNKHEYVYWIKEGNLKAKNQILKKWNEISFDLMIANDIDMLPLALSLKNGYNTKILFDAHEYYAHEAMNIKKEYQEYICDTYIPKADNMMTVCDGLAEEYLKNYVKIKPFVITNAPVFRELEPIQTDKNKIYLIHHGIAGSGRTNGLIEMMKHTDSRFILNFMIRFDPRDDEETKLRSQLNDIKNINLLPPIDTDLIPNFINKFDIGVCIFKNEGIINFNTKYVLPNKFFEFIQARLMNLTAPSIEMVKYIKKYDLGIVVDDFEPQTMAKALNQLTTEQIMHYKKQAHLAAYAVSGNENKNILLQEIEKMLS
ncbi:MAG: hypothetical protein EAZ20_02515 [Bacteroidetes bacterium]|nr:MAG: hypothetical protein EAZ20_02515 [Bacteroidota bacterium]